MKKRVAKTICGLLALQMVFTQSMTVIYAENADNHENTIMETVESSETESSTDDAESTQLEEEQSSSIKDSETTSDENVTNLLEEESKKTDVKKYRSNFTSYFKTSEDPAI